MFKEILLIILLCAMGLMAGLQLQGVQVMPLITDLAGKATDQVKPLINVFQQQPMLIAPALGGATLVFGVVKKWMDANAARKRLEIQAEALNSNLFQTTAIKNKLSTEKEMLEAQVTEMQGKLGSMSELERMTAYAHDLEKEVETKQTKITELHELIGDLKLKIHETTRVA